MGEPVSSALVLAGKGAGEVVTPKLREYLLGPLFKAYGDHWGAEAEERLRKRRQDRLARNTQSHLNAIALFEHKRTFEDVADDPTFDEWLQGASQVDAAVDPDLADFWRAALVALANGDSARLRLLRIVRSLGPDDAAYLASGRVQDSCFWPSAEFEGVADYVARMEKSGVFEGMWHELHRRRLWALTMLTFPLWIYFSLGVSQTVIMFDTKLAEMVDRLTLPATIFAAAMVAMTLLRRVFTGFRHLTGDGVRLLSCLDRVRNASSSKSETVAGSPEREAVSPS